MDDETEIRRPPSMPVTETVTPCVIVLSGVAIGQVHRLTRSKYVVGRGEDADIVLNDKGVSRHHARFVRYANGVITLQDLKSRNGTYVNGQRISTHALSDGDRVHIGSVTILKFSLQDSLEDRFQEQLYTSATRDPLTQTLNKRYFQDALTREFSFSKRHRTSLCVLVLDVDDFKGINDTYGHLHGDEVLRTLGKALTHSIREADTVCRVGGEEFAVIARGVDLEGAALFAERLRSAVHKKVFRDPDAAAMVTISIGVAEFDPKRHDSPDALVGEADSYLYEAKRAGRNCVKHRAAE